MQLYAHQAKVLELNPYRHLLAHGTGSGKTITAIALANENALSVLVVVPNLGGMLLTKWNNAIREFSQAKIKWTLITKEQFRKNAKNIPYHDALIWDEAHALANPKSQMHKQCRAWIKFYKPKYVWLLTATPYLSEAAQSVYAYGQLLGRTDWKWIDFRNRFYREQYLGRRVIFKERVGIEHELADLIAEIGSIVELKDCIDLPKHIIEDELYDMTAEQKALVKEVRKLESNPLVLYGKLHQIASGILIGNEYVVDRTVHAYKNDRVFDLAEKHKKLAVFSRYNAHLDLLAAGFKAAGVPYEVINGSIKDRPRALQRLENEERIIALINTSCSMGYELPSFQAICFASASFDYVGYVQSLGRFDRANQAPLPRIIYHLMTKGTLDEDVMDALERKESFSLALHLKKIKLT